jgi:hypothetical protein
MSLPEWLAEDWFFVQGDREIGPIPLEKLLNLVEAKRITGDTLVRTRNTGWVPAWTVDELPLSSPTGRSLGECVSEALDEQEEDSAEPKAARGDVKKTVVICFALLLAGGLLIMLLWRTLDANQKSESEAFANAKVLEMCGEAQKLVQGREYGRAIQLLEKALNTEDATNADAVGTLLEKAKTFQADEILANVWPALQNENVALARKLLASYLAAPNGTKKERASELLGELELALSDNRASEVLATLSEPDLMALENVKTELDVAVKKIWLSTLRRNLPVEQAKRDEARRRAEQVAQEGAQREKQREDARKKEEAVAKERAAEKVSPSLVPKMEDVDNYPYKFYGKFVRFQETKISGSFIEKQKDVGRFTLGVTSARDKFFSGVAFNRLFFSTSDKMANGLLDNL